MLKSTATKLQASIFISLPIFLTASYNFVSVYPTANLITAEKLLEVASSIASSEDCQQDSYITEEDESDRKSTSM